MSRRFPRLLAHLLCALPMLWLGGQMLDVLRHGSHALGTDPVAEVIHRLGIWALRLLLLTLAITPLRQMTGKPALIDYRRLLGLWAFAYASAHLLAYLALDLRGFWLQIVGEIAKRPYITVGFLAWLSLLPLAITSTKGWMRRLGRRWGHLHRLVYVAAMLAVLHFWWRVKADTSEPLLYASILVLLLGWRLWWRWRRRRITTRAGLR